MTKNVLFISDFDAKGSGYKNISSSLCSGLAERGYAVKAVGLQYDGSEHSYPFSIIPVVSFQDACVLSGNLCRLINPDIIIVALDIPLQKAAIEIYSDHGPRKWPSYYVLGRRTDSC
jgi:hypothetical protein